MADKIKEAMKDSSGKRENWQYTGCLIYVAICVGFFFYAVFRATKVILDYVNHR